MGAKWIRTAAGATVDATAARLLEAGAEALAGDLIFGVVQVGATATGAVLAAREQARAVQGHVETFREGDDFLRKNWLSLEQATGNLQTFLQIMRAHPVEGIFYRMPGLYGLHDINRL